MRKILPVIILLITAQNLISQTASVEKSTYGIQTGFLGIWAHNESRLTNSVALRSEIGLDNGIWGRRLL